MFFVFFQYLWPRLAPCLAGVGRVAVAAKAAYVALGKSLVSDVQLPKRKWERFDEEARVDLVPAPPAIAQPQPLLLKQRNPGPTALVEKEAAERLDARRLLEAKVAKLSPAVPLCVGFELEVAQTICCLAGVEACDPLYRTVLRTLQLLHCCGYSWELTMMTCSVALVYAETITPQSRHGRECACANNKCAKGLLEETWAPCSFDTADSVSTATNPTLALHLERSGSPRGDGPETTPAERARLLQDRFVLLMFLAHCYLVDDPCFLCTWNTYIFTDREARDLESLNGELMRLFKARGYDLKVDAATALPLCDRLERAVKAHPAGKAYDLVGAADAPA